MFPNQQLLDDIIPLIDDDFPYHLAIIWWVVPAHLKNMSQLGRLSQYLVNMEFIFQSPSTSYLKLPEAKSHKIP